MMSFQNKVVVVTGGASGIGKSLVEAFRREGAIVAVVDLQEATSNESNISNNQDFEFASCDVTNAKHLSSVFDIIKTRHGKIDVYCSNAGIIFPPDSTNDKVTKHSTAQWNKIWDVNFLSHVTALRLLLPDWDKGVGDGVFCMTASAAGLLTQIGDATYGVTKAAAVSLAEHLQICHPNIQVHCLCPQAVDTPFIDGDVGNIRNAKHSAISDGILSPDFVADCTLQAIQNKDEFFIFPHPRVKTYLERKTQNHKRWIKGMQRLRNRLIQSKL